MSIEIPPHALMVKGGGKYQLDLKELCRLTLIKSGIKDSNILKSDICTCCNSEYLHSHRATGGERGILCSLIYL
jgi:copper oxidase (laccase) domain-containing protein